MPRPIRPDEEHTYEAWQALGYQVQRGEHHVGRDVFGRPVFGAAQVAPRNSIPPHRQQGYQPAPRRPRRSRGETEAPTPSTTQSTTGRSIYAWDVSPQYFPAESLTYPSLTQMAQDYIEQGTRVRQGHYIITDEAVPVPEQAPIRQRSVQDYVPQHALTGFQKLALIERERRGQLEAGKEHETQTAT